MKIAYIASHIYKHTFEINEAAELIAQHPALRVYSFYQPHGNLQRDRVQTIDAVIVKRSKKDVITGFFDLLVHCPLGLIRGGLLLAFKSLPNPIYWVKNLYVFGLSMAILSDARRNGVTHLHANFGSSTATIAWLAAKVLGTTFSVTYQAFDIYSRALKSRDPLKKTKLRDASLVVSAHEDGRSFLRKLVPDVPAEQFCVIRICVTFDPQDKVEPLPEPPLLVAAGNLVPKKGFDVLIRAVAELKRRGVAVRARVLGEGSERQRLETLVRREAVRDRVELLGFFQHAELPRHLAEATAFVMPSLVTEEGQRDGIPTVVIEAWLSETPVVASLVGGMAEVIVDEKTGLVFPSTDAGKLADAVQRLIETPELRSQLVGRGLDVARSQFSPERNVRRLLEEIGAATRNGSE